MKRIIFSTVALCLLLAAMPASAVRPERSHTRFNGLTIDPRSSQTNSLIIYNSSGTAQVTITKAGAVTWAGAQTFSSTAAFNGDATFNEDVSLAVGADDKVTFTSGYFTKFRVGTGSTPDITLGTDDVFIEGTCEVDDELQVDGILDINSTSDFAGNAVFQEDVDLGSASDDLISIAGSIDTDITAAAAIGGGFDISMAQAATGAASVAIDVTGGQGGDGSSAIAGAGGDLTFTAGSPGTTDTDQDGADGGSITITAADGADLNGAGSNDGSGGSITLTPGASSGTGTGDEGAIILNDDVTITDLAVAAGADTACNTTCAAKSCWFGLDAGTHALVACDSALADTCICVGN